MVFLWTRCRLGSVRQGLKETRSRQIGSTTRARARARVCVCVYVCWFFFLGGFFSWGGGGVRQGSMSFLATFLMHTTSSRQHLTAPALQSTLDVDKRQRETLPALKTQQGTVVMINISYNTMGNTIIRERLRTLRKQQAVSLLSSPQGWSPSVPRYGVFVDTVPVGLSTKAVESNMYVSGTTLRAADNI